jgi:histidine ammonia-lyase
MVSIDGNHLTMDEIVRVARNYEFVSISDIGKEAILTSNDNLQKIVKSQKAVYGINTGFGIFASKKLPASESARLNRNLILSHAVGVGPDLPDDVVRAAMLIRANALSKGFSGIRLVVVQTLVDMLNAGVTPIIPSQGSLGSSGDLCCLSQLALVLSTDTDDKECESGIAYYQGQKLSGKQAMQQAGIQRVILGPKEGLALNNGATFSTAIGALLIYDGNYLLGLANTCISMTAESLLCCSSAFDALIHEARNHLGQKKVAESIRYNFEGGTMIDMGGQVQDAYSIRCAPHVHGAVFEAFEFVRGVISREINAATDNPLIFGEDKVLSGGNFHGEAVGMAMDFLAIAFSELGAISERRLARLVDGNLNLGLPPMLVDSQEAAGLNSGLMMPHYTAASLVLENQTLCTPDSVRSLPTSANQEDHNANSMTAARHAYQVLENTTRVLAIELYSACRAIDLRLRQLPGHRQGKRTEMIHHQVREEVPYQPGDALWNSEIQIVYEMIKSKKLSIEY